MERPYAAPTRKEHLGMSDARRDGASGECTLGVLNILQGALDRTLSSEQNGTALCNSLPASSLGLAILYAVWEVWLCATPTPVAAALDTYRGLGPPRWLCKVLSPGPAGLAGLFLALLWVTWTELGIVPVAGYVRPAHG